MNRLLETFTALTAIDSPSFEERDFCDALKQRLTRLGFAIHEDNAGEQIGGNCGNLYGLLDGELPLSPILLSAHMDTVEPGRGKKAILHSDGKISSATDTILGADNVSGIVIILEAVARLRESGLVHRPLEVLFTVAEEKGCHGTAVADYQLLQAQECYTLDLGGAVGEAANAAPSILYFDITVTGKAAHAGSAPSSGIHAVQVAAKAIARIPLGEVQPGMTVNIGKINGGEANNIIPALCTVTGEIRSLSNEAMMSQWEQIQNIFHVEAQSVDATVQAHHQVEITAYETPLDSPVVRRFIHACDQLNVPVNIHSTLGGSDQNHYSHHGMQGLVLACSMHEVHSTREYCRLDELEQCVELVMTLLVEDGE